MLTKSQCWYIYLFAKIGRKRCVVRLHPSYYHMVLYDTNQLHIVLFNVATSTSERIRTACANLLNANVMSRDWDCSILFLPYHRLDLQALHDRPSEEYHKDNTECSCSPPFSHLHWLHSSCLWEHLRDSVECVMY